MCFHHLLSSHILCVYMDIFQIYFLENNCQFWYSKHTELTSNRRGLSSTCILCLYFRFQRIQVVVQQRSFLLRSHLEMQTLHRVDGFFKNIFHRVDGSFIILFGTFDDDVDDDPGVFLLLNTGDLCSSK